MTAASPAGFVPHDRRSAVTDPWRPIFSRLDEQAVVIGFVVAEQHCNGRGFLHGGVIASLADNAMGLSVHRAAESRGTPISSGALTMALSIDYLSAAQQGAWIEIRSRVHEPGHSVGVVDCLVVDGDEQVVARGNATFRYRRSTDGRDWARPVQV